MSEKLRILVVEDNPADADFIHEMLPDTGAVKFQIESVARLAEALTRLERRDIDLVLLDLGLPDSQGLATFHKLRQAAPGVPVVVLTGNDDEGLAVAVVRDGAQDYLVKGQVNGSLLARTARYAHERQKTMEALQRSEADLRVRNKSLSRFNDVAIGRELRMIELKGELNELCVKHGETVRHRIGKTSDDRQPRELGDDQRQPTDGSNSPWALQAAMAAPMRILIVDDDPEVLKGTARLLEKTGYAVVQASTGEEALRAVQTERPELIVLDRNLPGIDGLEVCRRIKQDPALAEILVIIVSGSRTASEEQAQGLESGADGYIARPIGNRELLARLEAYVRIVSLTGALRLQAKQLKQRNQTAVEAEESSLNLMEDALEAASALRLRGTALEAAANSIVITDRDGSIEWVNPAFAMLTGYSAAEAFGRNPRELIKSGKHDAEFYRQLWETIVAGKVWQGEIINRRKDGSLYTEDMTVTPVRGSTGEITHFVGIKQDITARKQSEQEQRESAERYRLLFDENPVPMWLFDPETLRFLTVNRAAVQHYGYTREEFLAMTMNDIRPREDIPAMTQIVKRSVSETVQATDVRHRRKDGSIIHVDGVIKPMRFDGRHALLAVATDVTEKKLLEEKFLHAQRLESIGMLAAGIAHDLNNVLAPIVFAAPMLRKSLTAERDLKILDIFESSANRGAGLIKQILGFVNSTSTEFRPTQVKHLARDIIDVIKATFPKSIQFEQKVPTNLWPVPGNASQIHQVLLNLCVNARDAMPQGGVLRMVAANRHLSAADAAAIPGALPGAWLVLEVSDTGTGIPPAVLDRIWTPFFTTKVAGKGTGLGLATVRGIVLAHHGVVELQTEVGRGSSFRVYLPAIPSENPAACESLSAAAAGGRNELILVVDDETSIRDSITTMLNEHGYRAVGCADGMEAIAQFTARPGEVALVITDVDMPRMGGVALAKALLQLQPDLPFIAMSGASHSVSGVSDLPTARELAHAFLAKPFKSAELLVAVDRLLQPAEELAAVGSA